MVVLNYRKQNSHKASNTSPEGKVRGKSPILIGLSVRRMAPQNIVFPGKKHETF
jgi:hypothetical protein